MFLIGGPWKSNVVLEKSLRSPLKMVAIICMNSVRVFTVFHRARFSNMSEKNRRVFPSWLHFDLWLETRAKQGRSFFYPHPPKDDWNPNPQIFLAPFKKWDSSLSALLKNFRKGQNFIWQKNPNRHIWKPIILRGMGWKLIIPQVED